MQSAAGKLEMRLKTMFFAVLGFTFIFHLASTHFGYPHYRDIHLGTALEYARHGIDFFKPIIVGFNATNTPTPQEIPLWQAATALALRMTHLHLIGAVVISLFCYVAGMWPLYRLANAYFGERGAWWALIFYAFQPLVFLFSGTAAADGLTLSVMIWFVYACDRLVRETLIADFMLATITGVLLALLKLPYFMVGGITGVFLLLLHGPRSLRRWILLGLVGAISGIFFFIWSRYLDHCYSIAEFPQVNLRMTPDSPMWTWYFGDWHYRLNPANWAKGGWRALNGLFGSFAVAVLAICSLLFSKNRIGQFWLAAAFLTTLIFSHLVLIHHHYYLLYSPAVALLCASAAVWMEEKIFISTVSRQWVYTLIGLLVLTISLGQGMIGMEVVQNYDHYGKFIVQSLREKTTANDKLLIVGGSWGGDILFRSDRQGLSLADTHILETPANIDRLHALGFTKLVMINESPLLNALKKINPNNLNIERETWKQFITPTPARWPVTYQSEDMLIKEIPPSK